MVFFTTSRARDHRSATLDRSMSRCLVAHQAASWVSGCWLTRAAVTASRYSMAALRKRPCTSSSSARASDAKSPFLASAPSPSSRLRASTARSGFPPGT